MPDLADVRALVTVPDADLLPALELFWHPSRLHGRAHVARVLVHAFRLIATTGFVEETPRLWAAVYLHDVARRHDGGCRRHGADAWTRFADPEDLPGVRGLFACGGVREADYPAIKAAVTCHSAGEPLLEGPHRRLMCLLKDADGLDRVRLGDLDPGYLRFPEAREMVGFAEALYRATNVWLTDGDEYFGRVWAEVEQLLTT